MVTSYSVESGKIKALNDFAFIYATDTQKPSITFQVHADLPFEHRQGLIETARTCNQVQGVKLRIEEGGKLTFWGESSLCYLAIQGVKFEGDLRYKERARELGLVDGLRGQEQWARN